MNGKIYIAINKISNKVYIGQTTKSLAKRIAGHYRDSKCHTYAFANALRKYKKSDWVWKVLYDNVDIDKLGKLEVQEVKKYDSYRNGYNSTAGGEDNPMRYKEYRDKVAKSKIGKKRPDVAERMREAAKHRVVSAEARAKMSKAFSGEKNPMFGKHHSEEIRLLIAKKQGARTFVAIRNGEIVGSWINKAKCGRDLNIDHSSICKCLRGEKDSAKGYIFKFIDGGSNG